MDIVNVLQAPPVFFRLFLKLALSLFFNSFPTSYRRTVVPRILPAAFDVDPATGFFPPQPLAPLSDEFAIWEDALRDANGGLSLGEDESEEALDKRAFGEQWRSNVVAVRLFSSFLSPTPITEAPTRSVARS